MPTLNEVQALTACQVILIIAFMFISVLFLRCAITGLWSLISPFAHDLSAQIYKMLNIKAIHKNYDKQEYQHIS